ncbi:MAG: Gfo/Idh/MocA family protein [Planctomycetota bacterium]
MPAWYARSLPKISRRGFLARSAAAGAGIAVVPGSVLGGPGRTSPNERVVMGCIGIGGQGDRDMRSFLGDGRVQIVALCDVDSGSRNYEQGWRRGLAPAKEAVEKRYAAERASGTHKGIFTTRDFRELLGRDDIDAVTCSTPDHWHAAIVVAAAKAGKDIYCQKPLSLTIADGRAMVRTVRRYGRVFQCGSQRRSSAKCRHSCELVRSGRIGKLHTIRVGLPGGHHNPRRGRSAPVMPVPKELDYNRWLGPAPHAPYTLDRCHWTFRWNLDYSGGQMTDWGAHYVDMAHWGMGTELTGPVEIEGTGRFPSRSALWNTATEFRIECRYANGMKMTITSGGGGVRFEGADGWVDLQGGTNPRELRNSKIGPDDVHLYESRSQYGNFIDCVRSRKLTVAPVEVAHRSITPSHLGNIAMMLGRKLRWDPDREEFIGDAQANSMRSRAYRAPWRL